MNDDSSVEAIQERTLELGKLLLRVGENPDALGELRAAVDAEDVERFRAALGSVLGGPALPPDKCSPYVRVFITILKPPKLVRRCTLVARLLAPEEGEELARAVQSGIDPELLTDILERLGLIKCTWELESQSSVVVASKFVQGICPPGSF